MQIQKSFRKFWFSKKVEIKFFIHWYHFRVVAQKYRNNHSSFFFQDEEIFVQSDELDELDRITRA